MPKKTSQAKNLPVLALIERRIFLMRGQKIMLDVDLASLYQVPTYRLNEAIKRNRQRFPEDFMFQLTKEEQEHLISHFAISRSTWGGRRSAPYGFTEQGVAMLSSVLRSNGAVQMNILVMRAFVRLREILATNKDLAARVEKLEAGQRKHASIISILADEIENLRKLPHASKGRIGFST